MLKYALAIVLGCAGIAAYAQTITVQSSPAEDALVKAAKEYSDANAALTTMKNQAITTLNQNQKTLQDQIAGAQKALNDKLKADKKYKGDFENLADLQKKLGDVGTKANTDFGQQSAPLMQKVNMDKPLIDGLIPIVRKENGLPDSAVFDWEKGTW